MFISENRSLKAKAAGKKKRIAISARSSSGSEIESSASTIPGSISEPIERQALAFFFAEFVCVPRHQESCRGYIEYLLPLYTQARKGSPLFDATSAAAMAAFSRKKGARRLALHAHIYYGRAVNALQESVADPELARSNETLISIMVLGLFETMVASEDSLHEWGHHADGAHALVEYRGQDMFADSLSRKLYWAVRSQAAMNYVIKCEPLEPFLDWESLWKESVQLPNENHAIKFTALSTRIPALRAAAIKWLRAPMSGEAALKIVDLMGNAKVLDSQMAAWSFDTPNTWRPRVISTVEGELMDVLNSPVYPGNIDCYADLWISQLWNQWRSMRMVLQGIIVCSLERLFPPSQLLLVPEHQQAVTILASMADGLCASVPYHLGHAMPSFAEAEDAMHVDKMAGLSRDDSCLPRFRPEPKHDDNETKSIGAYYLMWPLFVAYGVITLPEQQREWLRGRLLHIGEVYKAGQAQVLGQLHRPSNREGRIETETDYCPPPWEPYPELGGILRSRSFRNVEAIADLQASTPEARLYRRWRQDFIRRLLAL